MLRVNIVLDIRTKEGQKGNKYMIAEQKNLKKDIVPKNWKERERERKSEGERYLA